jgi:HPt (histidine-containing phosphotransfer) domain-containing protein
VHPNRTTGASLPEQAVSNTDSSSSTETLPNLPGVKVAASVRRIGGNVALYLSLLDKFRVNHQHVVANIRKALASNDTNTAERLAHTLRGIAGTLGAESLQSQAELLENNIKNGTFENVETLLTTIDSEIASLITSIDQAIEARQG